ncbi:methyltransferase type 11 [candidate division WOR-1 bacterium RIFOXYB2_FULL_36_35]|uniref:Methyltransferase type 11 n=1 Tax=candidate division WOR-1 bacterium RIFOXYB2_FULL_36_35 TaxID=1802578 RepID=A0A1F4S0T1_UNCSA|nr:MAG: methyltransferase type 11 [candidate division WOR-1 bacterium RIFOXYB2_FULL_36_35]OGC14945.1 MAG: methyltransferase type 11 [candidate division WOR-1 bacterium RIFOXYA12_FULL_36_13]
MTFEFDGKKYKAASAHQKEWGSKLISEFNFKGNERVLDLGCGDGAITAQLAKLLPYGKVLGIDSSKSMIETSGNSYKSDNLTFKLKDINDIDFNNDFDLVFSNATLHWIKDHFKLLNKVYKALKTNGVVRFNFAADGNCSHFFKVIKEVMALDKYINYFKNFEWPWFMPTIEEYQALANKMPFKEEKVWGENADRVFPDVDSMVKWVDQPSLVPLLVYVDKKDKESFRNEVVNRMIKETIQNDGKCFETFRRVNFFARR